MSVQVRETKNANASFFVGFHTVLPTSLSILELILDVLLTRSSRFGFFRRRRLVRLPPPRRLLLLELAQLLLDVQRLAFDLRDAKYRILVRLHLGLFLLRLGEPPLRVLHDFVERGEFLGREALRRVGVRGGESGRVFAGREGER